MDRLGIGPKPAQVEIRRAATSPGPTTETKVTLERDFRRRHDGELMLSCATYLSSRSQRLLHLARLRTGARLPRFSFQSRASNSPGNGLPFIHHEYRSL